MSSLKICIVGAGISGLCAGIQIKEKLGLNNFTIFESQADVGGVWNANIYPGCACDIPMFSYSYSFAPMPESQNLFPTQKVVQGYLKKTAQKHGIYSHITFNTEVRGQRWDERLKKWRVNVKDKVRNESREELFDIVINGLGQYRVPNIPQDFHSFKGPMLHSAEWNPDVSLDNKIVGVIGSGSTAVQIIPAIAAKVKELHVYMRNPYWILPAPTNYEIPEFLRSIFINFPFILWFLRLLSFLFADLFVYNFLTYTNFSFGRKIMAKLLNIQRGWAIKGELNSKLQPRVPFACQRGATSNTFYKSMNSPNVKIHTEKIHKVGENSIMTENGKKQNLDVLILATGFRIHAFDPLDIIGKAGKSIPAQWKQNGPSAYLTLITHEAPNMFFLCGPNSHLNHYSHTLMIEVQVDFVMKLISEMLKRNVKCVSVTKVAEDEFMREFHESMTSLHFSSEECQGRKESSKNNQTVWVESLTKYWWRTRINFSHFKFE